MDRELRGFATGRKNQKAAALFFFQRRRKPRPPPPICFNVNIFLTLYLYGIKYSYDPLSAGANALTGKSRLKGDLDGNQEES